MNIKRFMASQLRKPSGWFGSLVLSPVMNRVNRRIIVSTLALLELSPAQHVLEIGFGGGSGLAYLARQLSHGRVTGLDVSADLVRQAERKFPQEISAGRIRVRLGNISQLPFPDASFDRVFTINTIYFWPDVRQGLNEIRRVLRNDGLAAVSLRSRDKMQNHGVTKYDFRLFSAQEVAGLMQEAGFRDVRVDHRDQDRLYDQVIVVGRC